MNIFYKNKIHRSPLFAATMQKKFEHIFDHLWRDITGFSYLI